MPYNEKQLFEMQAVHDVPTNYSTIPPVHEISQENKDSSWFREIEELSLPEYHGIIQIPQDETKSSCWKLAMSYLGPGALVAVGYMDPGNWSTDIAGGSSFGYKLLSVILISSIIAMFLQILAMKVGLVTNRDLAQACRDAYSPMIATILWIVSEIAICATDIAEVIGSAVALKLLFGLPLIVGVCVTSVDVLIVLFLSGRSFRVVESIVVSLILIITLCFTVQLVMSSPLLIPMLEGFIPSTEIISNKDMLFVSIGIIGATVMPHNLFLHSAIVLTRKIPRDEPSIRQAIKYGAIDSNLSLSIAFFVNAAILMVSSSTFYTRGYNNIATLQEAYKLLDPLLHTKLASMLFGIALLASGQNSTITGTLTGQIVMEGFMTWKISPTSRRLITRLIAIIPSIIATAIGGNHSANQLLLLSQVILSFALPFAVIPLVHISSNKAYMGEFANSTTTTIIAIIIAIVIVILNLYLLI
jgi:manganese transport protein